MLHEELDRWLVSNLERIPKVPAVRKGRGRGLDFGRGLNIGLHLGFCGVSVRLFLRLGIGLGFELDELHGLFICFVLTPQ